VTEHELLAAAKADPSPENIARVHVGPGFDRRSAGVPKGHRWMSVRTDGIITGWRLSTDAEEARFAQAEQYAREQSDFSNVTTDDDIEAAFGRSFDGWLR
jgi:hypothetical protein